MFVSNRQHVIILRQESEAELEDRLSEENKNILHNGCRDDTKFTKKCLLHNSFFTRCFKKCSVSFVLD